MLVGRTIDRLAHELIERLGVPTDYALVGIVTGGLRLRKAGR